MIVRVLLRYLTLFKYRLIRIKDWKKSFVNNSHNLSKTNFRSRDDGLRCAVPRLQRAAHYHQRLAPHHAPAGGRCRCLPPVEPLSADVGRRRKPASLSARRGERLGPPRVLRRRLLGRLAGRLRSGELPASRGRAGCLACGGCTLTAPPPLNPPQLIGDGELSQRQLLDRVGGALLKGMPERAATPAIKTAAVSAP